EPRPARLEVQVIAALGDQRQVEAEMPADAARAEPGGEHDRPDLARAMRRLDGAHNAIGDIEADHGVRLDPPALAHKDVGKTDDETVGIDDVLRGGKIRGVTDRLVEPGRA